MYRALTADETRAVEDSVVAAGRTRGDLMEQAGAALAGHVTALHPAGRVIVAVGPGNNGGDGWTAARELHRMGREVLVCSVRSPQALEGLARSAADSAIAAGVAWAEGLPAAPLLASAAVVVDALLGIGQRPPLRPPLDTWCAAIMAAKVPVIAVDVPTGVDADTGVVDGSCVSADVTVTFIAPKRGLFLHPGAAHAGGILVEDLGVDARLWDREGAPEIWSPEEYAALLPTLRSDTHKNERGRLLVVAGSGRYVGAAVLAARGAMRAGAGYVTLAVPEPIASAVQAHLLAATVVGLPSGRAKTFSTNAVNAVFDLSHDADAVVVGPGLTLADGAVALARSLVTKLSAPMVVDADGLNALVDAEGILSSRAFPAVITPHPGELARLLGTTPRSIQSNRLAYGAELASDSVAVVLKGAGTVTSFGDRQVVNTSGTPALATAGSGDVLAGVVGAFLAQGLAPLAAGALAAYVHGRAGESAAESLNPLSVTAEDLPAHLAKSIGELWRLRGYSPVDDA
jgi:NAD(P)H-hydrate epimerase